MYRWISILELPMAVALCYTTGNYRPKSNVHTLFEDAREESTEVIAINWASFIHPGCQSMNHQSLPPSLTLVLLNFLFLSAELVLCAVTSRLDC
jgi:hypothetical protein